MKLADIDFIVNKCFCAHTFERGKKRFEEIKSKFTKEQVRKVYELFDSVENPDSSPNGYGSSKGRIYQLSLMQLKDYLYEIGSNK